MAGVTNGLDLHDRPARATLNKLNLIDFCLKNGSLKFKTGLEDSFDVRALKNFSSDESEELVQPIRNIVQRISELLDKPDELKRQRDEAQKLRERIKGVSNDSSKKVSPDDPKYGGYSSEDQRNSYDKNFNVSLSKKLGIVEPQEPVQSVSKPAEPSIDSIVKKPTIEQKPPKKQSDDFDLLGDLNPTKSAPQAQATKAPEFTQEEKLVDSSKKKGLPPPPKKGQLPAPPSKSGTEKVAGDLLNLDLGTNSNKPKQQPKGDDHDFDLLGGVGSSSKDNGLSQKGDFEFEISLDTKPKKAEEKKETDKFEANLFDLSDLKADVKPSGPKVDDYVQFLAKTQKKLAPPPKAQPKDKYDFLGN